MKLKVVSTMGEFVTIYDENDNEVLYFQSDEIHHLEQSVCKLLKYLKIPYKFEDNTTRNTTEDMKLYKIQVTHYAPKDSHTSIEEYVVAKSNKDVFDYLAAGYAYWEEMLGESDEDDYWEILENQGDDREVYDLYYGATQYSWEEVELVDDSVINLMIINGLAKQI